MRKYFLDFETRSILDIKKCGAWAYAQHSSTEIICLGTGYPGEKAKVFSGQYLREHPADLVELFPDLQIVAHNATFEYAIYNYILHKRYGWPAIWEPERWNCTMVRALMCGLPASLEHAGTALGLRVQKDLMGRAAMLKLCKPIFEDPLGEPVYNESPGLYERLYAYCMKDVETEILLDQALPEMPPQERKLWELDLIMNRRGVQVDLELAQKAASIADNITENLNQRLYSLSKRAVSKASQVAEIKRYLVSQGVETPDGLDKQAVTALLAKPEVPSHVKEVLAIRRQVGKSSTAKYIAAVNAAGVDGRVRGALQYHAAATGRWGGRLIQPQNYPKGLPQETQLKAIQAIKTSHNGVFGQKYGSEAMETLSGALRGTIIAAPGYRLIVADYNAIEARVLFWEAGDIQALSTYMRGESPYVSMARYVFKNETITKKTHPKEYDIGKRLILAAGYGMGWPKFQATCLGSDVIISEELAQTGIKAYREKYRSVVNLWYATERAALNAIKTPGQIFSCAGGRISYGMSKDRRFLGCRLPSGRYLRYYRPEIKIITTSWGQEKEEIHYWAAGISGKLEEQKTYGGALVENYTQAVARDIMANGMLKAEAAGYPLIMTLHDELVSERKIGEGTLDEFISLICQVPIWAEKLPMQAEGFESERYRK